jgi:hypothetical protein
MRGVASFQCGERQTSEAKRFLRMTACVGCEIQRSGLPRRCEGNIRAVVHGPAAAIAQTIDNLVGRMYERVGRFIRSKWKHDAAHQHAGQGRGQTANGDGMPAGVRAANASTASTPGTVDPARAQSHDDARRTKKARTDPWSTSARCVSGPPAVARALRARAASQPSTSMRCVYAHARRAREGRQARVPAPASARTRSVGRILRIGHHLRLAAREVSLNGARRETQGGRVCRAKAREVEARRGRVCAEC